ncbi:MAG: hypothetical protein ACYDG3_10065 [Bacillati bacterium]
MTVYIVEIITHEKYKVDASSANEAEDKVQAFLGTDEKYQHRLPDSDEDPSKGGFWWEAKTQEMD